MSIEVLRMHRSEDATWGMVPGCSRAGKGHAITMPKPSVAHMPILRRDGDGKRKLVRNPCIHPH